MKSVYKKNTFAVLFEYVRSRVTHADSRFLFFNQQIDILKKICTHLRQKNMEADTKLNNYINKKINKEKQPKLLVNCFFDPLKSIKNKKSANLNTHFDYFVHIKKAKNTDKINVFRIHSNGLPARDRTVDPLIKSQN